MSKDNNNNDDYIEFKPELQGDDEPQDEHVDSHVTGDINNKPSSSNENDDLSSNNASDSDNSNDELSKDDLSSTNNDNRSNDLSDNNTNQNDNNNQDNNNDFDKDNELDNESDQDTNDLENNEENDNMNDLNEDESNINDNSNLNDSNKLDNDDDLSNENNVNGNHDLDDLNGESETGNDDDINNLNNSDNDNTSDTTGDSDNEQNDLSNDSGNDKSNDNQNTDDLSNNNDSNNGYDDGSSKNDATNDNTSELDPNDLNTSSNQSNDDINNMSKDLPSNQVNPDDDSKKESDAATDSNPDTDSKKENDAATDSNPDTDSKKENDATKDTNPDEDSKKENDAAKDLNPDENSKKGQSSSNNSSNVNSDPNNNLEKGIQKGASALGFGDEAKAAQTAKNLKDSLNDAKGNSKEKMQSAIKELGVSTAKGAIKAAAISYLWPVLLAVLALIFVSILVFGSFTLMNNESDDDGCSADDKSAAMGSITTSKNADKNAENIYKYIISNSDGAKPKGVASLLGNMFHESAQTFDPSTIQNGSKFDKSAAMNPSVGGYAFGIAQWDSGRRVKLLEYAEKKGKKWDDLELQLDYLLNGDGSDSELIKKLIKSDDDVEQTTENIMRQWERAGRTDSLGSRQAASKKYYAKFADIKAGSKSNISDSTDAGADNSDACGGGAEGKTDGTMGASVKPNGGTGDVLEVWEGKDKIPEKYRKLITLPDFSEKALDAMPNNIYLSTNNRGQCTELTWGYMSQLWSGTQPTAGSGGGGYADGNGQVIWKAYKENGAKITKNPTVGYGFSGGPPIEIGGTIPGVGHTGVVVGVLEDGKYIIANYNLRGEANRDHYTRSLTYALVDGQPKSGQQITFFSGIGKPKIKVDK